MSTIAREEFRSEVSRVSENALVRRKGEQSRGNRRKLKSLRVLARCSSSLAACSLKTSSTRVTASMRETYSSLRARNHGAVHRRGTDGRVERARGSFEPRTTVAIFFGARLNVNARQRVKYFHCPDLARYLPAFLNHVTLRGFRIPRSF